MNNAAFMNVIQGVKELVCDQSSLIFRNEDSINKIIKHLSSLNELCNNVDFLCIFIHINQLNNQRMLNDFYDCKLCVKKARFDLIKFVFLNNFDGYLSLRPLVKRFVNIWELSSPA